LQEYIECYISQYGYDFRVVLGVLFVGFSFFAKSSNKVGKEKKRLQEDLIVISSEVEGKAMKLLWKRKI
jgi:hypothetical protein